MTAHTGSSAPTDLESLHQRVTAELPDLPESTFRRMLDYTRAAASLTNGRHDFHIPFMVADDWAIQGYCVLKTGAVERRLGAGRRTAFRSIARLLKAGAIREIGRTPEGHRICVPCLEIGDEWRARQEAQSHGG